MSVHSAHSEQTQSRLLEKTHQYTQKRQRFDAKGEFKLASNPARCEAATTRACVEPSMS